MKDRLVFIDGLRGIAATLVMMFHYVGRVDLPLGIFEYGSIGVAIFFALSGFVIAMNVSDKALSWGFLGRFALRRAIRLDIPYWASLTLIVLIAAFGAQYGAHQAMPTLPQLGAHLIYTQDFLGFEPLSPVFWSLCFEVQFYLFLVVLLMALRAVFGSSWHYGALIVFCVTIVLSLLERSVLHIAPRGLAAVFWFNFALGSITYFVVSGKARAVYLYVCLAAVFGVALATADLFGGVAATTCGLMYLAFRLKKMGAWLSMPSFQFLGRISYSLYIFHNLIGWYALSIAQKFVNDWIALAIGVATAIVSAWMAYLFIEKPSMRLSRKVQMEPSLTVNAGAVAT